MRSFICRYQVPVFSIVLAFGVEMALFTVVLRLPPVRLPPEEFAVAVQAAPAEEPADEIWAPSNEDPFIPQTEDLTLLIPPGEGLTSELPRGGESDAVSLEPSFRVAGKEGSAVSHMPAVLYTGDGMRFLACTADGWLYSWDASTRGMLGKVRLAEDGIGAVGLSSDGAWAVCAPRKGGVRVVSVVEGTEKATDAGLKPQWIAVSPGDRSVALAIGPAVEIRGLPDLRPLRTFSDHEKNVRHVAWRGDGKVFASVGDDGRL
ncbi:MAG: hypothetical protein MUC63_00810, partial [Planctomycetes bacterium]|nr:hypothetical protein [Planctomycetota bacterium]